MSYLRQRRTCPRHPLGDLAPTTSPPAPGAACPPCICKPAISPAFTVGLALVGLALNIFRVVRPSKWGS